MIRFALAILLLNIPQVSSAQQVTVRSGEHGEFTRLVFDVPLKSEWVLETQPGEKIHKLSFKTKIDGFDLRDVYKKIDRERIENLSATSATSIEIRLGCDCLVEAFLLRNRMLVVDVKPKIHIEYDVVSTQDLENEGGTGDEIDRGLELSKLWLGDDPRIGPVKEGERFPVSLFSPPEQLPENSEIRTEGLDFSGQDIRQQVFGDVANAATQGLLEQTQSLSRPPNLTAPYVADDEQNAALLSEDGIVSIERDASSKGRVSFGGQRCESDRELKLAAWEDDSSDASQSLSARRGAMFEEFDRINRKAQLNYVKTLLYYGFGAEARSVAEMGNDSVGPMYIALSYLVDGERDPTSFFGNKLDCESYAAMWAALDASQIATDQELSDSYLLQAFEALPNHLKTHLGPILASNLTDGGFSGVAKSVLRRLERVTGKETDSILLGKAQIDLLEGNEDRANESFVALSVSDGPETAVAIAAAVDIARSKGGAVSERIVELSAAYSTELRNAEMGPELWQAHLRSLVLNGRFDDAIQILASVEGVPEELLPLSINETFSHVLSKSDDVAFLKYFFYNVPAFEDALEDSTIMIAARRVSELGLPKVALATLKQIKDPVLLHEKRIVEAEALIELSRPDEAEILLIGLNGPEIARLRALARSRMGDHEYAKTIYEELGDGQNELRQAWLSGDWGSVAEQGEGALASAADLAMYEATDDDLTDLSLKEVEALHSESTQIRNTIRNLLDATQFDTES